MDLVQNRIIIYYNYKEIYGKVETWLNLLWDEDMVEFCFFWASTGSSWGLGTALSRDAGLAVYNHIKKIAIRQGKWQHSFDVKYKKYDNLILLRNTLSWHLICVFLAWASAGASSSVFFFFFLFFLDLVAPPEGSSVSFSSSDTCRNKNRHAD